MEFQDVVIIGGGPGGISAAMWCSDLGRKISFVEGARRLGGQLHSIHNPVGNYPGVAARNGAELAAAFERSLAAFEIDRRLGVSVISVDADRSTVQLSDGSELHWRALIVATGVRRRRLGVSGETEFIGRGVLESGSFERDKVAGKRVVVVGGGDAAAENALILVEHASRVFIVHRRSELSARPEFVSRISDDPRIEFIKEAVIEEISGTATVESVGLRKPGDESIRSLETDFVIARIGVEPNSDLLLGSVDLDPRGYIIVDAECGTSRPGIYAIGDVACPISPTIATAVGMGAIAAKSIFALLSPSKQL